MPISLWLSFRIRCSRCGYRYLLVEPAIDPRIRHEFQFVLCPCHCNHEEV